jgi:death-on-curing protein
MASEPTWLSESLVRALHAESLGRFGGTSGIRDRGLLESALARPWNRHAYGEDPSVYELAAAYCFDIVRNHPFVDGNKRAELLAARAFLFQNGHRFVPDEAETVQVIEGMAAGEVSETELATWIQKYTTSR